MNASTTADFKGQSEISVTTGLPSRSCDVRQRVGKSYPPTRLVSNRINSPSFSGSPEIAGLDIRRMTMQGQISTVLKQVDEVTTTVLGKLVMSIDIIRDLVSPK